ncbi:MAG: histidine phosphatase family protein [Chloroflexota bacterium]
MLTLVLTRHGFTDRSDPVQFLGQCLDVPLSARGRADAGALGRRLAGVTFDRVISSPLLRARETATLAAPGRTIETDARLAESDFGEWEGFTIPEVDRRWPGTRAAWADDPARNGPPGGENAGDVARRVRSFLADLAASPAPDTDPTVLVVGHSTLNRILLAVALDLPVRDYRRRFRQDWVNLTVLRLEPDGRGLVVVANDTSHLDHPRATPWT